MILFDRVRKEYPDGTLAVADFSLEVPSRQVVVLLGSSGCGKTTLLRMVNRMVTPTEGAVWIDDEKVAELDPVLLRRRIGYVMQNAGLLPHRTVAQNVATVLTLTGQKDPKTRVGELLELVGLPTNLGARYPAQLSGGQQQRVGVARALATNPKILLMDEPFGAVDPVVRQELQQELLQIQRDWARTILFVTHDVDEAMLLGDRVLVLRAGAEIAQQGTADEILWHPADDFVASFIGADRRRFHLDGDSVLDRTGRLAGKLDA